MICAKNFAEWRAVHKNFFMNPERKEEQEFTQLYFREPWNEMFAKYRFTDEEKKEIREILNSSSHWMHEKLVSKAKEV